MRIPILRLGDVLLAAIHVDVDDSLVESFQQDLLGRMEKTGARALLIDISGLEMVDTYVARVLTDTGKMARLMGARTVLVGMRPEVAATLVRMGFGAEGIETALDCEEGWFMLTGQRMTTGGTDGR